MRMFTLFYTTPKNSPHFPTSMFMLILSPDCLLKRTDFPAVFQQSICLGADAFQLGFLKVLRGTPLAADKEEYGIVCRDHAPYEVISTNWITAEELVRLKTIENMLNIYYNRGGFSASIVYMMSSLSLEPFDFYEKLADFYYENGFQHKNRKKEDQYRILRLFAVDCGLDAEKTESLLEEDLRSASEPKK